MVFDKYFYSNFFFCANCMLVPSYCASDNLVSSAVFLHNFYLEYLKIMDEDTFYVFLQTADYFPSFIDWDTLYSQGDFLQYYSTAENQLKLIEVIVILQKLLTMMYENNNRFLIFSTVLDLVETFYAVLQERENFFCLEQKMINFADIDLVRCSILLFDLAVGLPSVDRGDFLSLWTFLIENDLTYVKERFLNFNLKKNSEFGLFF